MRQSGERLAERREDGAAGECRRHRREKVPAMEGGRSAGRSGQRHDLHFCIAEDRGEDPVVGADEGMSARLDGDGGAIGADARIHHDEMHGAGGKAVPRTAQQVCTGANITGRNAVGHVHQRGAGGECRMTPFTSATYESAVPKSVSRVTRVMVSRRSYPLRMGSGTPGRAAFR